MGETQNQPFQAVPHSPEALLHRVPFFQQLDRVHLARLVGAMEEAHFQANTVIFAEGAEADGLYLLARGRVEVTVGALEGERSVATLEAPAYFGELGLLLGRRTAAARAVTDIQGWKLPRARFEQLVRDWPLYGHVSRGTRQ